MPKVSVLLVNRNGKRFLPKCLASLKKQTYRDFELVFVDNASTDNSVELALSYFPKCTLVRNKKGLGFCGGNNKGYFYCKGKLILLLNNDVILPKDVISKLVKIMESDERIAAVGASQYAFGESLSRMPEAGVFNLLGEGVSTETTKDIDGQAVIACGLIRKAAFPGRIFDPIYGTGGEDIFLSLDARSRGYRVIQSGTTRFWHHGTVRRGFEPERFHNYERTGWLNLLRFFSTKSLLLMSPVIVFEWALRTALSIVTLRFDKLFLRTKAQLWILLNQATVSSCRKDSLEKKRVSDEEILLPFLENPVKIYFFTTYRYVLYQSYFRLLRSLGLLA